MIFRRRGTYSGGIVLPLDREATFDNPIAPVVDIERLLVPLDTRPVPQLLVQPGQTVQAGQPLTRQAAANDVIHFAPLDGRVGELTTARVVGDDFGMPRLHDVPALELVDVSTAPLPRAEDIESRMLDAGDVLRERITGPRAAWALPTGQSFAAWFDRVRQAPVKTLLLNAAQSRPHATAAHRLLVEHGAAVLRGLAALRDLFDSDTRAVAAVEAPLFQQYPAFVDEADRRKVEILPVEPKYPIGNDRVLAAAVLARRFRHAGQPGVTVVRPSFCWDVSRMLALEVVPTHRVVTLWDEAGRSGNFHVPIGTCVCDLLPTADSESLVIDGDLMTGVTVDERTVVRAGTDLLARFSPEPIASPRACIRCGWCVERCPARLNVAALNDDFELGRITRRTRRAVGCVGCGICSYVCPAHLPLRRRVGLLRRHVLAGETLAEEVAR